MGALGRKMPSGIYVVVVRRQPPRQKPVKRNHKGADLTKRSAPLWVAYAGYYGCGG